MFRKGTIRQSWCHICEANVGVVALNFGAEILIQSVAIQQRKKCAAQLTVSINMQSLLVPTCNLIQMTKHMRRSILHICVETQPVAGDYSVICGTQMKRQLSQICVQTGRDQKRIRKCFLKISFIASSIAAFFYRHSV